MDRDRLLKARAVLARLLIGTALGAGAYAQQAPTGNAPPTPKPAKSTNAASPAPGRPDKVVLKVGAQQVTADDLNFVVQSLSQQDQKAIEGQGRRQLGEQYAMTLLLAQQAAQHHLDSTPEFRREEAWARSQRLAKAEYEKMAQAIKVNPDEVGQYYSQHAKDFEELEVRQVGIRKKAEGAKPGSPGLAPQDAQARAEAIRKALAAGTDIKKVTTDFAMPNVVFIDRGTQRLPHGRLTPDLDKAVFALKDGELSQSIDTPQTIVFVQVMKHVQPDLKEVQPAVEATLRQQKMQSELGDLKNKANVWMDEDYFKPPTTAAPPQSAGPAHPPGNPPPKQ
jgi:parvulin-like peptidyl-prolyl isomerase